MSYKRFYNATLTSLFFVKILLNSVSVALTKCYLRFLMNLFFERLRDWFRACVTLIKILRAKLTRRFFLNLFWCIYVQSFRFLRQFSNFSKFSPSVWVYICLTRFTRFSVFCLPRLWAFQEPHKSIRWACGNLFR